MNTLVIVDNDPGVLHMLEYLILSSYAKKYSLNVYTFTNPADALKHLSGAVVVITDMKMYPIDGVDFIREVWAAGYKGPVIVYSAFADRDTEIDLLKLHADYDDKKLEAIFHKSELTKLLLAIEKHMTPRQATKP